MLPSLGSVSLSHSSYPSGCCALNNLLFVIAADIPEIVSWSILVRPVEHDSDIGAPGAVYDPVFRMDGRTCSKSHTRKRSASGSSLPTISLNTSASVRTRVS